MLAIGVGAVWRTGQREQSQDRMTSSIPLRRGVSGCGWNADTGASAHGRRHSADIL
jgi:hypothetical protein